MRLLNNVKFSRVTYFTSANLCRIISRLTRNRYSNMHLLGMTTHDDRKLSRSIASRWLFAVVNRLWYCDVTQTSFVTSFWSIVLETFLRTLRLVTVFPPPYQLSCHSLFLIIESDSQHFHWLAFKKIFSYSYFLSIHLFLHLF